MKRLAILRGALAGGVCALALATAAHAQAPRPFDLPAGDLSVTLEAYIRQSGAQLIYQPSDVRGRRSARVSGSLTPEEALDRLLAGTGLRVARDSTGAMMIVRPQPGTAGEGATGDATQVGDIVVTGSRIRGALPTAPVRLVTREEIDRSGFGQTGEIVRSLPENFSGGQNPGVLGATAGNINNTNQSNASTVNLRGLGTDATLAVTPTYYWFHALQPDFSDHLQRGWQLAAPYETPDRWAEFVPTRINAPLLMQMPEQEYLQTMEYYSQLVSTGYPAEMFVFPHEPHVKIQPRHKLAAYERNLDWFRFWLLGYEDPDPRKDDQYRRWTQLRDPQHAGAGRHALGELS